MEQTRSIAIAALDGRGRDLTDQDLSRMGVRTTATGCNGKGHIVSFVGTHRGVRIYGYHDWSAQRWIVAQAH